MSMFPFRIHNFFISFLVYMRKFVYYDTGVAVRK